MNNSKSERPDRQIQLRIAQIIAIWVFLAIALVYVLVATRRFLIPLVLAIFATVLIETLTRAWMRIPFGKFRMPRWIATTFSVLAILYLMYLFVSIVADNANRITADAPEYEKNLRNAYETLITWGEKTFGWEDHKPIDEWVAKIDLRGWASSLASGLAGIVGDGTLILTYLYFLLLERKFIRPKIVALFPDTKKRKTVVTLLDDIQRDVRVYIGMKTLVSILTAVLSLIVLWWVGVRYAEFWALLIFVFNFIPTVGSIVATLLPAMLTLVQFPDPLVPFLIVACGIWTMQLIVSNLIEPQLMGNSLNMSTFVVILALVFWGMIWGVSGMFL